MTSLEDILATISMDDIPIPTGIEFNHNEDPLGISYWHLDDNKNYDSYLELVSDKCEYCSYQRGKRRLEYSYDIKELVKYAKNEDVDSTVTILTELQRYAQVRKDSVIYPYLVRNEDGFDINKRTTLTLIQSMILNAAANYFNINESHDRICISTKGKECYLPNFKVIDIDQCSMHKLLFLACNVGPVLYETKYGIEPRGVMELCIYHYYHIAKADYHHLLERLDESEFKDNIDCQLFHQLFKFGQTGVCDEQMSYIVYKEGELYPSSESNSLTNIIVGDITRLFNTFVLEMSTFLRRVTL
jgi:hypothetical protein